MKIISVNILKEMIDNGLNDIHMQKLGQIVLLVGKNGSGKTRLLNKIKAVIHKKPPLSRIENAEISIISYKEDIAHKKELIKTKPEKSSIYNSDIQRCNEKIEEEQKIINWDYIETDKLHETYKIIDFIPEDPEIEDYRNLKYLDFKNRAEYTRNNIGVKHLRKSTCAIIQDIQNKWFHAIHQNSRMTDDQKDTHIKNYQRLNEIIKQFLNTDLDRNSEDDATLFGFSIGSAFLSAGQRILLKLCVALYGQEGLLDNLILFLDEPENHLHPSAIIDIIERIKECLPNGQIWIATHSISIISYFIFESVWYMEKGTISYGGEIPEKVIASLLGNDERIDKLKDFTDLPASLAFNKFSYESLFTPLAIKSNKNGPQTVQIRKEINDHFKNKKIIRILDYGAGKGRFLRNSIMSSNLKQPTDLKDIIYYIAFDKINDTDCIDIIEQVYQTNSSKRYFNAIYELKKNYDENSFDIIIMCNVFHEIDPNDWLCLFKEDGIIPSLLQKDGFLLILEDQFMPIGEKAYQKGFLVLDLQEIKKLFKIKENDINFKTDDARCDGRLKSFRIPRDCVIRITDQSRIDAIRLKKDSAIENIKILRSKKINYKNRKLHGFWTQQLANSILSLNELT